MSSTSCGACTAGALAEADEEAAGFIFAFRHSIQIGLVAVAVEQVILILYRSILHVGRKIRTGENCDRYPTVTRTVSPSRFIFSTWG